MKPHELAGHAHRILGPSLPRLEEQLRETPDAVIPPATRGGGDDDESPAGLALESAGGGARNGRRRLLDGARRAIAKVRREGPSAKLDPDEQIGLEAIVVLQGRPVLLIQEGKFAAPPQDWRNKLEPVRHEIEATFPSVGRVELNGHPSLDYVGTGFLVADQVLMTNRHVAKEFCRQEGKAWTFEPGMKARVDYNAEYQSKSAAEFALTEVIGIHDTYDLALFRVAAKRGATRPRPLPLAAQPAIRKQRDVYIVGYPASDGLRNDPIEMGRIFSDIYKVKRLQPGTITGAQPAKRQFLHDCSTLGGNSGSCVIDLETRKVVGLHFSGRYLETNYAIELGKLARDPLLRKAGVEFV